MSFLSQAYLLDKYGPRLRLRRAHALLADAYAGA